MRNTQDCLKAFNSLDEINSDEKGYAKNAEYSFKGTKAANIDIYNVSNDFSKSHVDGGMNSSEGYLFSPKQSHANRLPSLQSTDMIRKGPSLNRIEVYNTNRLVNSSHGSCVPKKIFKQQNNFLCLY